MSRTLAIAGREFRSYFLTPTGYVITALFLVFTGLLFSFLVLRQGEVATLRPVFERGTWVFLFVGPAITMRAISEELRLGTLEALLTSPVTETQVVLGKFLGAISFLLLLLVPTVAYVLALELYGRPDYGEILCGYLGMVLAGAAYLASGLLTSTFTGSQVVAYLLAMFFWLMLSVGTKLVPLVVSETWARPLFALDPDPRLRDFAIGLADTSNVVYFASITALFLLGAIKFLEWRRWR